MEFLWVKAGTRGRRLAATAGIAALALALALAGCGGKSGNGGSGGQGQASGGSGNGGSKLAPLTLNPNQVVAASATKTLQAGTAKVAMTIQVATGGRTTTLSGDGAFDFTNHRGTLVLHLPQIGDVPAVYANGVVYEKLGQVLRSGGKPWVKIDLTKLLGNSAALSPQSQAGSDPSQNLAYLFGASGITKVGQESIRGVATTHYRGTLDLTKASQRLSPQFASFYQKLLKATGTKVSSVPADIWIDGQGRLSRMTYSISSSSSTFGTSTTKTTVEYFSFGTPVNVQLPPADQVTSLG